MSMSSGPKGGRFGKKWSYNPIGRVCKIKLYYGKVITGIRFCSVDGAGKSTWSKTFGERFCDDKSMGDTTTISIRYPEEKLTKIEGTRQTFNKRPWVITSLTFTTNMGSYGPFGQVTGSKFIFPNLAGQMITNFNGRALDCLYAIGIKFIPCREADNISNGKKQQKTEVGVTATKSEEEIQTFVRVFEQKIRAVNCWVDGKSTHVAQTSTDGCPISFLKGKISAIVCGGLERLSSDEISVLEPLCLKLSEKKTGFSEGGKLVMLKLKVAIKLMKEVTRLGELKNMLTEQEVEYKQEYARRDECFTVLKKAVENKNDEKLLQSDEYHYKSDLNDPSELFNSSMSAFLTKFQQKAQKLKKLKDQIGLLETKKTFAFDLLMSIG